MNQPKLQPSTDAEWRVYFENKCREQRKQLAAAEARAEAADDTAIETIARLEKRIGQLWNACRLANAWFCKPEFGDGSEPNPFQVAKACKDALEETK